MSKADPDFRQDDGYGTVTGRLRGGYRNNFVRQLADSSELVLNLIQE